MLLTRLMALFLILLPVSGAVADPVRVKVTLADGRTFETRMEAAVIQLDTEFGVLDLKLDRIREIDFEQEGNQILATVTMPDRNHITGSISKMSFRFVEPAQTFDVAELRELKVIHDAAPSMITLVLGLVTLTVMEIVLGIDNIIFLAIVAGRLPPAQQPKARRIGLVAALATRLGLLFTLTWLLGLTRPVITLPLPFLNREAAHLSWRDIILLAGGAFLIVKSVREVHHKLEESKDDAPKARPAAGFIKTIILIAIIDIVFSLDSVITAVGMVETLWVMVTAMVLAMGVMMLFAEPVSRFVEKHPTVKVLALSFLILIGVLLVAEGLGQHIEKGYVYFAMAFAVAIEFINMRLRWRLPQAVADG